MQRASQHGVGGLDHAPANRAAAAAGVLANTAGAALTAVGADKAAPLRPGPPSSSKSGSAADESADAPANTAGSTAGESADSAVDVWTVRD